MHLSKADILYVRYISGLQDDQYGMLLVDGNITLPPLDETLNGFYIYVYNKGLAPITISPSVPDVLVPIVLGPGLTSFLVANSLSGYWTQILNTTAPIPGVGTVISVSNAGSGVGFVKNLTTTTPNIKSLLAGLYMSVVSSPTDITINNNQTTTLDGLTDVIITAPVNGQGLVYSSPDWINQSIVNTLTNTGAGLVLVVNPGINPQLKSLLAGTRITITNNTSDITIASTYTFDLLTDNNNVITPLLGEVKISGMSDPESGILSAPGGGNLMQLYSQRDTNIYIVSSSTAPYSNKLNNIYTSVVSAYNAAVADGFGGSNPATVYVLPGTYTENASITLTSGVNIVGVYNSSTVINLQITTSGTVLIESINFVSSSSNAVVSNSASNTTFRNCNWSTTASNVFNLLQGTMLLHTCFINCVSATGVIVINSGFNLTLYNVFHNYGQAASSDIFISAPFAYTSTISLTNCIIMGTIQSLGSNCGWKFYNTMVLGTTPMSIGGTGTLSIHLCTMSAVSVATGSLYTTGSLYYSLSLTSVQESILANSKVITSFTLSTGSVVIYSCMFMCPVPVSGSASIFVLGAQFISNIILTNTGTNLITNSQISSTVYPRNGSGVSIATSPKNTFVSCNIEANPCFDFDQTNYVYLDVVGSALTNSTINPVILTDTLTTNHQISLLTVSINMQSNDLIGIFNMESNNTTINMDHCQVICPTTPRLYMYSITDLITPALIPITTTLNISNSELGKTYTYAEFTNFTCNVSNTLVSNTLGGFDDGTGTAGTNSVFTIHACLILGINRMKPGNNSTSVWNYTNTFLATANGTSNISFNSMTFNSYNSIFPNINLGNTLSTFRPLISYNISLFNTAVGNFRTDLWDDTIPNFHLLFYNIRPFSAGNLTININNTVGDYGTTINMINCHSNQFVLSFTVNTIGNTPNILNLYNCAFIRPTANAITNNTNNVNSYLQLNMSGGIISVLTLNGHINCYFNNVAFATYFTSGDLNAPMLTFTGTTFVSKVFATSCSFSNDTRVNNANDDLIRFNTGVQRELTFKQCTFTISTTNPTNLSGNCINYINCGANAVNSYFDRCVFYIATASFALLYTFNNSTAAGSTAIGTDYFTNCEFTSTNTAAAPLISYKSSTATTGVQYRRLVLENCTFNSTSDATAATATSGIIQFSTQAFIKAVNCSFSSIKQNIFTLTTAGASTAETGVWIEGCNVVSNFDSTPRLISWNSTTPTTTGTVRLMGNIFNIGAAASALMTLPATSAIGIAGSATNISINSNSTAGITLTPIGTLI